MTTRSHVSFAVRTLCAVSAVSAALLLAACGSKKETASTGGSGSASTSKPAAEAPAPTGSAVVQGVVRYEGAAPAAEPWPGAGNADCKGLHPDTIQLVKVQDGKLEDAFVYIKDGLPKGSYPASAEKVVFDQKGCEFSPRVFGVMTEQPIEVGNSDKFMHNVKSPEFNQGFPFNVKKTVQLTEAAVMSTIKCDVHPWMRAYAGVMEHPYFAVTKTDGAFSIKGLPDGEYTVAAWHEKLGSAEQKIKATGGAPAAVELVFKPK